MFFDFEGLTEEARLTDEVKCERSIFMEKLSMSFVPRKSADAPVSIGAEANGDVIGSTEHHLLRDGKPWYPIMGEFHFSRYPADEWELELQKMKALGVRIVATYVFWIYHEEEKGVWRTDGNLDLRRFVLSCKKTGMEVLLRIGPWAHGECRNGGFPDWLQHDANIKKRTDDPAYLALVKRFYENIFESVRGLFMKDGGPIMGVQIENEYGHCGGESGGNGLIHMKTLKRLAVEVGFKVPMYTATGWGGGNVVEGEMLPVMAGYAAAPWDRSVKPLPANKNYLLVHAPNDPMVASDWNHDGQRCTYNIKAWPYLTAELGGGSQCTFHRRPLISARDTYSQALCSAATGANMLGYYMFHGGIHAVGRFSTLQESRKTGSHTDVPVRSYDFQAPIGESGELNESAYLLKGLHTLASDFGESLAASECYFPENVITDAENLTDVRFCVRYNEKTEEGFLFINNHQRLRKMKAHSEVVFEIKAGERTYTLPAMDIPEGFGGVIPFNLRVGNGRLVTTNAQLFGKLNGMPVLFTRDGQAPVLNFDGAAAADIVLLTEREAHNAWYADDRLIISDACIVSDGDAVFAVSDSADVNALVLPERAECSACTEPVFVRTEFEETARNDSFASYSVNIGEIPSDAVNDVMLCIDFVGDHADVYSDGELIADWYTTGQSWRLALKRYGYPKNLEIRVFPVTSPTYFEIPVPVGMSIESVSAKPQYKICLGNQGVAIYKRLSETEGI